MEQSTPAGEGTVRPRLIVIDGPGKGQRYVLEEAVFAIGRQDANDLQILESAVSRRHCEIHRQGDDYELRDVGSARGTFVNGVPVGSHTLAHGDFLQISTTSLVFLHETPADSSTAEQDVLPAGSTMVAKRPEEVTEGSSKRSRGASITHGLVGESPAMKRLLDFIDRVAGVDSTVLLRGESGTGKELAARALHRASRRVDGPFIEVNCATLSETLLESELFGHERGAFTGAVGRKIGRFEAAHGGTLFLDEVGEVPISLQARLLRALQERRFERVGGKRAIAVDVRVIAATNRDLEAAIRDGTFREDLFYRLNVIQYELPPLRDRREDVPLLARHFVRRHGERLHRPGVGIDRAALRALVAYDWPGNVRQLSNTIERALVLGDGEMIRPEDLPDETLTDLGDELPLSDYQTAINATKRRLLTTALAEADGNAAEAGRRLGLHPNSFRRLMRQLGLRDGL
ncbi:MAG: sigma 54-interacting transcriptional regulator [Acidobacteriota bacterium]